MVKGELWSTSLLALALGIALGSLYSHHERPVHSQSSNLQFANVTRSGGISDVTPATVAPRDPHKGFTLAIINNLPDQEVMSIYYWDGAKKEEIFMANVDPEKSFRPTTYYDNIFVLRFRDGGRFIRSIVAHPDVNTEFAVLDKSAADEYFARTG
jgi:hypothetical protein